MSTALSGRYKARAPVAASPWNEAVDDDDFIARSRSGVQSTRGQRRKIRDRAKSEDGIGSIAMSIQTDNLDGTFLFPILRSPLRIYTWRRLQATPLSLYSTPRQTPLGPLSS